MLQMVGAQARGVLAALAALAQAALECGLEETAGRQALEHLVVLVAELVEVVQEEAFLEAAHQAQATQVELDQRVLAVEAAALVAL